MSQSKFSPGLIAGIIVALFVGVALYLRIGLPYGQLLAGEWVKFSGVDAYYSMRIVDNLVHNFPHLNSFDPYTIYPGGGGFGGLYFFHYLLAGIVWLVGLGSPSQHLVDVVGMYFPAVLAGLTVVAVYFVGKALFNRWAGAIAAGLVAILPGEFLGRSILGFTDYHVAEVLFTTVAMLFLILAVKCARERELTFERLKHRDWPTLARPVVYSLLAGIFLGMYFLTWAGALLFVLVMFVGLVIQFIIDHLKGKSTEYLCFVGTITFVVALVMFVPASPDRMSLASLIIAMLVPIALAVLSRFMANRELKPVFYPAAVVVLGLASYAVFYLIEPHLARAMMGQSMGIFRAWPRGTTVLEMQPILFPGGEFSWQIAWGNFTTGAILSIVSLGVLTYFVVKRGEADKTLLLVWSLLMLAATLSMRRFAYYFVVNVALLSAYVSWLILSFAGFRERVVEPARPQEKAKKKSKQKKKQKGGSRLAGNPVNMALGVIVVFFVAFFPNIGRAADTAGNPVFAPKDGWCESLSWLKDNTPEPFGDPGVYYELRESPAAGESYSPPETAYGVTAWWDYGYWISRMGRRVPTSNPGSGHKGESRLFMAQDEATASKWMDERGSRYVMIDHDIATVTSKFHALAKLSGNSTDDFYEVYRQPQDGKLVPVVLYYPEYYRSLVIRLYGFDGSQVSPQSTPVISYEDKTNREGVAYKEITDAQSFASYEEAEAYVESQETGNCRIVGSDPFVSPVPLEALENYRLVYASESSVAKRRGGAISEVKIFEYVE